MYESTRNRYKYLGECRILGDIRRHEKILVAVGTKAGRYTREWEIVSKSVHLSYRRTRITGRPAFRRASMNELNTSPVLPLS